MTDTTNKPVVWTIGGSDSGGGAGIQADLKTMTALGGYACSVITAITAQNTLGVQAVDITSPKMIRAQLESLANDLSPVALKIGMLGNADVVQQVADFLRELTIETGNKRPYIVCDPVISATSGDRLLTQDAIALMIQELFPLVDLLTPNRVESQLLTTILPDSVSAVYASATALLQCGVRSVLIKGGHTLAANHEGESTYCQDYWTDGEKAVWLNSPRQIASSTHGTGCTLSAAITTAVALAYSPLDAAIIGKSYVNQGIRLAPRLGSGHGPLAHLGWPESATDMPALSATSAITEVGNSFPDCGQEPLGFYPIVNRADWLGRLLPLGVKTIQLRIKDLSGEALEHEIVRAIRLAKRYDCRLFINDHWELAMQHGAYGVHLGQSDLLTADIDSLRQAGLRLGVSTHCYEEVSRALTIQPSYVAVGPIFETTTKQMTFKPQGLSALKRWKKILKNYPVVAIAGIFLENAQDVLDCGADGIAVVREITQAENLELRVKQWLTLWGSDVPCTELVSGGLRR